MNTLSRTPATIVAHLLVSMGVGGFKTNNPSTEPGVLVAINGMPDSPDAVVAVTDSPLFRSDGRLMNGEYIHFPGIQIRCRNRDQNEAYAQIEVVRGLLQSVVREEVEVDNILFRVDNLSINSPSLFIGYDSDSERPNFTLDVYATIKEL